MPLSLALHPDFEFFLERKDQSLIDLYNDLRQFIIEQYPEGNELLYHTHALTSLYSVTEKMSAAFCMINIYSNHLNLGFNKGAVLKDEHGLLEGTGKVIRHIPVTQPSDYRNEKVRALLQKAIALELEDVVVAGKTGQTISKIKRS